MNGGHRNSFIRSVLILFIFFMAGCSTDSNQRIMEDKSIYSSPAADETHSGEKYKVLHIMSYHSPWEWTDMQLEGFQDALEGLDIEYKVFQMNAKNISETEALKKAGEEARKIIDEWNPDLVYTTDDEAQEYVGRFYADSGIPFVFSAVNKDPGEYQYTGSKNVSGVLEVEHFVESANLFKEIVPSAQKVAVVFDDSPIWSPVIERMKSNLDKIKGLDFIIWDRILTFDEYKQKIKEYEGQVDAVALIGIFNFKDKKGVNVHYRDVLKWTAENSRLPDFSFWKDRVTYGTLCVVSVSGYQQGQSAGRIARAILTEGKLPSDFEMKQTGKGEPVINLARAKQLGIKINSQILLSSQVIKEIETGE